MPTHAFVRVASSYHISFVSYRCDRSFRIYSPTRTLALNWINRIKVSRLLYGRSRSIRKYTIHRLVIYTIPRRIRRLPMGYPSHRRRGLEHTRNDACLTSRYRQLSRMCRSLRQKHITRPSMSLLIRRGFRHRRFVPRVAQRWRSTKIHVLGRVLRKRGTVRVSARRNVPETESAIENGNGNGNATETEIGSRDETAQGAVVVRCAESVDSITHTQAEIGRWQKEWDFETVFHFSVVHLGMGRRPIVYLVRKKFTHGDLDVPSADMRSSRRVSITYRSPSYSRLYDI